MSDIASQSDSIPEAGQSARSGEKLTVTGRSAMQGDYASEQISPSAPSDAAQVETAINRLGMFEGLQPEAWKGLSEAERLAALQSTENTMADIQRRPALAVLAEPMAAKTYGYYDGQAIHINQTALASDDVAETVDTVVHEGRHAYQDHAISHRGFHPDNAQVQAWNANQATYLDAQTYGQEAYQSQPLEADAWSYAASIRSGLYH